jgi:hypothetical protein
MIKCWCCNQPVPLKDGKLPHVWTYERCPECGEMNRFRPGDDETGIVTEPLNTRSAQGDADRDASQALGWGKPRANDSDLGRAIEKIIRGKK